MFSEMGPLYWIRAAKEMAYKVAKRVESQVEPLIKMKGLTIKSSGPGASASRPCAPELWGKGMYAIVLKIHKHNQNVGETTESSLTLYTNIT